MLMVTALSGFGARAIPPAPFTVTKLGTFAYTFTASTTGTLTIPSASLGADQDGSRQILLMGGSEAGALFYITVNGLTTYGCLIAGYITGNMRAWGFPYPSKGSNITLTLLCNASITESGVMVAYEVFGARPLWQAYRKSGGETSGGTVFSGALVAMSGNIIKGVNLATTDTATATWAGLTEVADADVGTYALSDATLTVGSDYTNTTISADVTAGSGEWCAFAIQSSAQTVGVRGGFRAVASANISSTTATFSSGNIACDNDGLGPGDVVLAVHVEGDSTITGVTWGGVAMTSRGTGINTAGTPDVSVGFFSIPFTQANAFATVVVTLNNAASNGLGCIIGSYSLYNVGSYGTAVTSTGNSVGTTANASVQKDGMVLSAVTRGTIGTTVTTGVGADYDIGSAFQAVSGSQLMSANNAAYAVGHTGPSSQWVQVTLPVNP